jgi:hypothetical protein
VEGIAIGNCFLASSVYTVQRLLPYGSDLGFPESGTSELAVGGVSIRRGAVVRCTPSELNWKGGAVVPLSNFCFS